MAFQGSNPTTAICPELDYFQGLVLVPLSYDLTLIKAVLAPTRWRQLKLDAQVLSYSNIPEFDCNLELQGMQDWLQEFVDFAPLHLSIELIGDIGNSYLKTLDANEGHDIFALEMTLTTSTILNKAPLMILSGCPLENMRLPNSYDNGCTIFWMPTIS